ncbi:MAG: hypothetical protein KJ726_04975 [Verrucomicrobia bacterium]|nr:hypothetical protein [Verrucomicrobiota bacterium]MBU1909382.1 hypothetical protein [Verrucomicrobiota bacterium]
MMNRTPVMIGLFVTALWPAAGRAGVQWGRSTEGRRSASLAFAAGQITALDGYVQETTRPYYDITDPEKNTLFAKSYTLEELGFDGGYGTFGLLFDKAWSFFTLHAAGTYLNPSETSTADRDFYIGVEEVYYQGEKYEYMVIPDGETFKADMEGGTLEMRGMLTPVSITGGDVVEITPSIGLGLNTFVSTFDIDAGRARGTVFYEAPPQEYVVGGHGKGWTGMILPELGVGLDVRMGGSTADRRTPELVLQGYYALLDFSGDTRDLGITSSRNNKVLNLEYDHFEARALLGIPMGRAVDLLVGVAVQHMKANAEVLAEDRPPEEVEERREKFNKIVELEMTSVTFLAGLRF